VGEVKLDRDGLANRKERKHTMINKKQEKNHEKAYMIGMEAAHLCFDKAKKRCGNLHPINVHGFVSGYLQAIANHAPSRGGYEALIKECKPIWK